MKPFCAILAACFSAILIPLIEAAPVPVSGAPVPGSSGAGNSFAPAFSADGRFVVFVSHANNLVTNDDRGLNLDVFVRDLILSNTVLVSANTTGLGGGNDDANYPAISSNGQFVAFASRASNLVNGDTNEAWDVFVRDITSGTTRLVSVDASGTNSALGPSTTARYPLHSSYPLISADGRWVAFQSSASNMVTLPDTNRAADVFVRDLQSNVTYLVSVNAAGTGSGEDKSELAGMTPDGRFIAFTSSATDLTSGSDGESEELFVRDVANGITYWASSNVMSYLSSSYRCFFPVFSADGGFVCFKAEEPASSTTSNALVLLHELPTGVTTLLDTNSFNYTAPSMSADGRFTAFDSTRLLYGANFGKIYVWDSLTQTSSVVSISTDCHCPATGIAFRPALSSDGFKVSFLFTLANLTPPNFPKPLVTNDVYYLCQLYARDLVNSNNHLVSIRQDGTAAGYGLSFTVPAISPDGGKVAFESTDEMLVNGDNNRASDVFIRDVAGGTTDLISARHPDLPASTGSGNSWVGPNCVSADGQVIVFSSLDGNLHERDTNRWQDTYWRNLGTNSVMSLTYPIPSTGDWPAPPPTNWFVNDRSGTPVISANGRFATYMLGQGVWRRELLSNNCTYVTNIENLIPPGISTPAHPFLEWPISSDGRFVLFRRGLNFDAKKDVYARDMASGTIYLLSSVNPITGGNGSSIKPLFSPDDRWVVFQSLATDLSPNTYIPPGSGWQMLAMDFASFVGACEALPGGWVSPTNFMRLISYELPGMALRDSFTGAVFSANSRHVAFYSTNSLSIYRHDLFANATNVLVCTNCLNPSLSGDGRFVAYEGRRGSSFTSDIFVKDLQTGDTQMVSVNRAGSGGGNGGSSSPQISYDGRFIVFASRASDLVDNDGNSFTDVFVRDRRRGVTMLVSLNSQGTSGNSGSGNPVLGADGRTIVFQSFATDLAPGTYNDTRHVFVARLGGADTDADGMDDDWEAAYFGDLSRDGTGDYDHDTMADLAEFLAGTDPANSGSILQVFTVSPLGGGATTVFWRAAPGKTYRVQFKDNITDAGWTDLPGDIVATSMTGAAVDASATSPHRYYRVKLAP